MRKYHLVSRIIITADDNNNKIQNEQQPRFVRPSLKAHGLPAVSVLSDMTDSLCCVTAGCQPERSPEANSRRAGQFHWQVSNCSAKL